MRFSLFAKKKSILNDHCKLQNADRMRICVIQCWIMGKMHKHFSSSKNKKIIFSETICKENNGSIYSKFRLYCRRQQQQYSC